MAARGEDVYLLSGSDENSLKNVLAAEKEGLTTRALVDRNVVYFEKLSDDLRMNLRRFIRTSVDQDHIDGAVEIWRRMEAAGDIYAKDYEGLYCVGCEQFYSAPELIEGKCPEHFTVPDLVAERNYFFRLSNYGDKLLAAFESGELKVVPETRLNEVTSFIRSGLADISISRSTERARGWGIPVPGDDSQVMYVWIDALTNYVNALGWTRDGEDYQRYWVDAAKRIHVVGRGVTRFHAVYWPAMLMSTGLPLPTEVVVHGYITAGGIKLSKSLGNADDPAELLERFGSDAVRYYLLAEFSPFSDGDFTADRLVARYNCDLANGLGNLISRATSMTVRYRDGVVPQPGDAGEPERELVEKLAECDRASLEAMTGYDHREALARIWDLVREANAYVDVRAPWHLAKSQEESAAAELDTTLYHLVGIVRQLGRMVLPFIPDAGAAALRTLGADATTVPAADRWGDGLAGATVIRSPALFPRIEVAP
jgi:methionyl-tRNA synthetase